MLDPLPFVYTVQTGSFFKMYLPYGYYGVSRVFLQDWIPLSVKIHTCGTANVDGVSNRNQVDSREHDVEEKRSLSSKTPIHLSPKCHRGCCPSSRVALRGCKIPDCQILSLLPVWKSCPRDCKVLYVYVPVQAADDYDQRKER